MRIKKKGGSGVHEGDLTPMIDMTFQLIAFFMVLINFTEADQNKTIQLPDSTLAKPPDSPPDFLFTLHLTGEGRVIYGANPNIPFEIEGVTTYLEREISNAMRFGGKAAEITVIIRGDKNAETGKVQQLIKKCQDSGLETFALRVKERVGR